MLTKNKKLISVLLIISFLLPGSVFLYPKNAKAALDASIMVPTVALFSDAIATPNAAANVWQQVKRVAEYVLMAIIQRILDQMTQDVVGWINSGFHGSPLFLENPDSFFKDIAKSEIKTMIDQFGYDLNRFPFGRAWALNTISAYKSKLESNVAYTLSSVMGQQQAASFRDDFNVGGWNGFLINTQYPQNNYLGFQMLANEELASLVQGTFKAPAEKVNTLLDQGMGFLSPEKCMDEGTEYNDVMANAWNRPTFDRSTVEWICGVPGCPLVGPRNSEDPGYNAMACDACHSGYQLAMDSAQADWASKNTCKNLVNTTPGSVVADQIMGSLSAGKDETIQGAVLGSIQASIATIINALLNKFLSDGLNSLSDTISGTEEPVDNWTYDGQSLDGTSGTGGGGAGALDIPQNVSITMGGTNPTSTTISGGTPPYSIKVTDPITPNPAIATASILNNDSGGYDLSITGISHGGTSVTVKDSSPNAKKVKINITVVENGDLMIIPASITTGIGGTAIATVSGGTPPYHMSASPSATIAISDFTDPTLVVSGINLGQTSATITDSMGETITLNITIEAPTILGTCTLSSGEILQDISESDCTAQEGVWIENE
ncbi:MAG: hypothetical protein WC609_01110 [Candidatus Paceibacterota bacterium]|jgi:hypothetical protein